jgi:hypothetical protein
LRAPAKDRTLYANLIHPSAWKANSPNFALTEFYEVRSFVLHMARKASREVVGVFLRELSESARRLAADPADDVRNQLPRAPSVGRCYEGQFVGAPPGQAALGDELVAKACGSAGS